jgi:hypothetical protein
VDLAHRFQTLAESESDAGRSYQIHGVNLRHQARMGFVDSWDMVLTGFAATGVGSDVWGAN